MGEVDLRSDKNCSYMMKWSFCWLFPWFVKMIMEEEEAQRRGFDAAAISSQRVCSEMVRTSKHGY